MNYTYFELDKNPKQFKKLKMGKYDIELRIEWNTRSKCWYVLGYIGQDIVLRNTKVVNNQFYRFDLDVEYYLPYLFTIYTAYSENDWDTTATFILVDDPLYVTYQGLTIDGILLDRSIATSSSTHSKKARRSDRNAFLFDLEIDGKDEVVVITCDDAISTFITLGIPQGRWDFTINNFKSSVAIPEGGLVELNAFLAPYGIVIASLGSNRYEWSNTTLTSLKIDAVYPYADGYELELELSSNNSLVERSVDGNGWVNRFTVCLNSE